MEWEPCPWDWKTALRKACKDAQATGYRTRVIAYPSTASPTGYAWTYRSATRRAVRFVDVPARWKKEI